MSTIDELKESLNQYETQLNQVLQAYSSCENAIEKESLNNLKEDLKELLALTKETLNEQQNGKTDDDSGSDDDPFADEMRLFMEATADNTTTDKSSDTADDPDLTTFEQKFNSLKAELSAMIGKKCMAPHTHTWGSVAYHNAFICGLDEATEYTFATTHDFSAIEDDIQIRVMFTNPTHREMVPCAYYLDGDCKFDRAKCRFSHGELVKRNALRPYVEPNFAVLSRRNVSVLAKQSDRIWYKGQVIDSDFEQQTTRIRIETTNKEVRCNFEDVLPDATSADDDDDGNSDRSSSSDVDADIDDAVDDIRRRAQLIEMSLLRPCADRPLGEWEKYTKGFGSKMMQKYGYVIGTGLGQNGEGIVVPIGAQILPPGRSLDHCMALREQANGDADLFSVERKLKKEQRRQEALTERRAAAAQQNTAGAATTSDMFAFLNENVAGSSISGTAAAAEQTTSTISDLKKQSQKNLNVAGFKLAEDIRRKEREIEKLKESMRRHLSGTPVFNKLSDQLQTINGELSLLKRSEMSVTNEQTFRKNKSKISVF